MLTRQLQIYLAMLLACLLAASCATTPPPPEPPAPEPVEEPAPPPPPPPPPVFNSNMEPYVPGTRQLLKRVFYFEFDKAVLAQADLDALQVHAQLLIDNPDRRVVVEGHCDERGTREYNLALGERRSDAVRGFLAAAGVPEARIETVSYGEERPDDAGHTEAAWSRNRRAVMIYR